VALDDDEVPAVRGPDLAVTLTLPYREAETGCTRYVPIVRLVKCGRCRGTGAERGITFPCQACAGTGCGACHGTGRFAEVTCDSCDDGLIEESETIQMMVPAGAKPGDHLRFAGKGDAHRNRPPGDLLVTIEVDMIGVLVQRGDDVVLELEATARQLLFGGTLAVATLDGLVTIELPRGLRDGHTITLAGRGHVRAAPPAHAVGDPYRDLARGDQLVVFRVPPDVLRARARVVLGTVVTLGLSAVVAALAL